MPINKILFVSLRFPFTLFFEQPPLPMPSSPTRTWLLQPKGNVARTPSPANPPTPQHRGGLPSHGAVSKPTSDCHPYYDKRSGNGGFGILTFPQILTLPSSPRPPTLRKRARGAITHRRHRTDPQLIALSLNHRKSRPQLGSPYAKRSTPTNYRP